MGDSYGFPEDLRRLISSRTTTVLPPPPHEPLSLHHHPPLTAPPNNNTTYDPIDFIGSDVFFPPRASSFSHHYHHAYNNASSSSLNPTATTSSVGASASASDHAFCSTVDTAEKGWLGFDTGTNRWPRQETLSLLEIRSRLDSKFRENNQKAPLWNEISRIMAEEFGYQRSGKKCKEKFENLYKYYKKTKEGKASRQDGKHYRFFRQLEAICGGEASSTTHASASDHKAHQHHHAAGNTADTVQLPPSFKINQDIHVDNHHHGGHNLKPSESLSFSNSSELETSSSENNNDEDLSAIAYMLKHHSSSSSRDNNKQKGLDNNDNNQGLLPGHHHHGRVRRSWRAKVEEIVGSHMRKIIETQDAWMERMLSAVEQREQEMASKEEERKKKESMRFDQEVHELWAKERAWVEARDAALIEVVRKHIGNSNKNKELELALPLDEEEAMVVIGNDNNNNNNNNNNKNKSLQVVAAAATTNDDGNDDQYHHCGNHHNNSGGGRWSEMEISNLIQLRTGFEQRLRENGYLLENGLWDEIAGKLASLGFDRSPAECKQIWDEISISLGRTVECGAKTRPWCLGLKLTDDDDDL